ncbi:MAG: ATP-binding protein [Myxococcales bacterium]|nr:ATP-binding protein [Myxococcales bacterium]
MDADTYHRAAQSAVMNQRELIGLVNRPRALPWRDRWVEFKRNNDNPPLIGEYISALANEACLRDQPRAYLVFGIDNQTHNVVGDKI